MHNSHGLETGVRVTKGRELWCIVVKYFATDKNAEAMCSMVDLQKVSLRGERLEAFQNRWHMVLGGLPLFPENTLEDRHFEQTKSCRLISEDIAHYN